MKDIIVKEHRFTGRMYGNNKLFSWGSSPRPVVAAEIEDIEHASFYTLDGSSVLGPAKGSVITLKDGTEVVTTETIAELNKKLERGPDHVRYL